MSAMSDLDITLGEMVDGYIVCALWSSWDGDEPLDDWATADDIAPATLEEMRDDCQAFLMSNHADIVAMMAAGFSPAAIGHDFWLTRNGHGAGFWDRGLGDLGERLSSDARVYGGVDLYTGDDGQVWA